MLFSPGGWLGVVENIWKKSYSLFSELVAAPRNPISPLLVPFASIPDLLPSTLSPVAVHGR